MAFVLASQLANLAPLLNCSFEWDTSSSRIGTVSLGALELDYVTVELMPQDFVRHLAAHKKPSPG